MIQLATDPNASRTNWQSSQTDDRGTPQNAELASVRRHAWPFISRHADKPAAPASGQKATSEHGS